MHIKLTAHAKKVQYTIQTLIKIDYRLNSTQIFIKKVIQKNVRAYVVTSDSDLASY